MGVSGSALDAEDAALVGVVGTEVTIRFVGVEVGVTRPSDEGVYAAASFAAALPNDGVRIPRLRLPLLGVTAPSLDPDPGDSPGRGPCGVTGVSPGRTGNGIINLGSSFRVGEGPLGVEVIGSDLRGVGRCEGNVSLRGVDPTSCAILDTVGALGSSGRLA